MMGCVCERKKESGLKYKCNMLQRPGRSFCLFSLFFFLFYMRTDIPFSFSFSQGARNASSAWTKVRQSFTVLLHFFRKVFLDRHVLWCAAIDAHHFALVEIRFMVMAGYTFFAACFQDSVNKRELAIEEQQRRSCHCQSSTYCIDP